MKKTLILVFGLFLISFFSHRIYIHGIKAADLITKEEILTGGALSTSTLSLGPVQGGTNQLYILFIADHKDKPVQSVSGLNLVWSKIAHQCSATSTNGMTIYQAFGSPAVAGNVTINLSGSSNALAATLLRYSGADPLNPTTDAHGQNTLGPNGGCTSGTDNASPMLTMNALNSNSLILSAVNLRAKTMKAPDSDYIKESEIKIGTSGYATDFLVYDRNSFGPGNEVVNHVASGNVDWVMSAVIINAESSASTTPTALPSPTPLPTPTPSPVVTPSPTITPSPSGSVTMVGAGDIANCASTGDEATASLIDQIPGTVFTLGDNVYPDGTLQQYNDCYGPNWGRFKFRTMPVIGNHEYNTPGATGYFSYYGAAAGDPSKGYYSYDLGSWHVVVLNSNCSAVGGCTKGSPQEQWLVNDLQTHPQACTVAMWHHPLFGSNTSSTRTKDLFQDLYDNNAELVLNGHAHIYERFAPQTASGVYDANRGVRQIVAGMGGESHGSRTSVATNSEAWNGSTFGVLKLTLNSNSYDWQFIPVAGQTYTDSGSTVCH